MHVVRDRGESPCPCCCCGTLCEVSASPRESSERRNDERMVEDHRRTVSPARLLLTRSGGTCSAVCRPGSRDKRARERLPVSTAEARSSARPGTTTTRRRRPNRAGTNTVARVLPRWVIFHQLRVPFRRNGAHHSTRTRPVVEHWPRVPRCCVDQGTPREHPAKAFPSVGRRGVSHSTGQRRTSPDRCGAGSPVGSLERDIAITFYSHTRIIHVRLRDCDEEEASDPRRGQRRLAPRTPVDGLLRKPFGMNGGPCGGPRGLVPNPLLPAPRLPIISWPNPS